MCTGFFKKTNDLLFAYNFDIDLNVWNYQVIMNKNIFTIQIKIGSTKYYTHGVTKDGKFAILPYMNDKTPFVTRKKKVIGNLVDRYLRNKLSYEEVENIVLNEEISNVKFGTLHSIIANNKGEGLLVEPGLKPKKLRNYGVITNYPLMKECNDDNPFYGKDRYAFVTKQLENSNKSFSAEDAINLLKETAQKGTWATRLSFVYSKNNNCVYYMLNNDGEIKIHKFE